MTPNDYCQQKTAASGSSFYPGFLCLPRERKTAIMALYAFCREVDDIVDDTTDAHLAAIKLAWWREEVERVQTGTPQHPVGLALAAAGKKFRLPARHLLDIIDGMEMDLRQTRYPDFESLGQYCYRVASVVGLLSAEIFGYQDERTLAYAHDLGMAFQLTNIIRDVGEDARRGRIYLPTAELRQFNVPAADLLNRQYSENFVALMQFQYQRAEGYYEQAMAQLPAVDRKSQRPGLIMSAIYRALLQEIRADNFQVLHQRISLPPARKLWLALKTWARS
ncbi:MAG: presqualene diphosphate synthase HpnD [Zoogloeaceae bacterium]|jgi:phytoene synthase|nr:presqualene diphosphate synthase HpnD [Zoogloeaceae bacterium]